jgi:hypothetical protein
MPYFDGDRRVHAARSGNDRFFDAQHVAPFCGALNFHAGRHRADHAVTQQNAEESTDQGGCDVMADLFRAAVQVRHRDHDAEHGRDDAETRQRVARGANQADGLRVLGVVRLELRVEQHAELLGGAAVDQLLQTVDQKIHRVMALRDTRVRAEQRARSALAHVRLQREHALTPDQR